MNKIWIIAIIFLVGCIVAMEIQHKLTLNTIKKEHEAELNDLNEKYLSRIERIKEKNEDVLTIYKNREDNLISINEEQKKILEYLGREEVIKEKPKLVEPKLNESFRGIIDDIAKETNRGNSN